jgi:hypothetical protein
VTVAVAQADDGILIVGLVVVVGHFVLGSTVDHIVPPHPPGHGFVQGK